MHLIKYLLSFYHMQDILLDNVGVTKMPYRALTMQPHWLFYFFSYFDYAHILSLVYIFSVLSVAELWP